jgi:hypothetical protein
MTKLPGIDRELGAVAVTIGVSNGPWFMSIFTSPGFVQEGGGLYPSLSIESGTAELWDSDFQPTARNCWCHSPRRPALPDHGSAITARSTAPKGHWEPCCCLLRLAAGHPGKVAGHARTAFVIAVGRRRGPSITGKWGPR